MKLTIPDETLQFLQEMRAKKVLYNLSGNKLDHSKGVILVACGDCDQMPDIWKTQEDMCLLHRSDPRIHIIALNAGALKVPHDSPLSQELREDLVLMKNICESVDMKEIETIVIYTHFPCGAATKANLTVENQIQLLIDAKDLIKSSVPKEKNIKVSCFIQINWPDGRKRSYHLSRKKWQQFIDGRK